MACIGSGRDAVHYVQPSGYSFKRHDADRQRTHAPPLRQYPRTDGLATSRPVASSPCPVRSSAACVTAAALTCEQGDQHARAAACDLELTLYRPDTRVWTGHVADADAAPIDLTGHTFLAEIRADRNRGEVVATLAVEVINGPGGVIRRVLTAKKEANKLGNDGARLYWDMQSTDADGFVRTWLAGPVVVKGDAANV